MSNAAKDTKATEKAKDTKAAEKTKVNIEKNDRKDTERYVGTNKGSYLVQTGKDVAVPRDVKEAVMLAKMQKFSSIRKISEMELKQ